MAVFGFFKTKEQREIEGLLKKINTQIFPEGESQFLKEVAELRQLLDFRYSKDEVIQTYSHASGIYFIAQDKSEERIVKSILFNPKSVVTIDDAITIFNYLSTKNSRANKKKSLTILSNKFNCEPDRVKQVYIESLREQNFTIKQINDAIKHWHAKRVEESNALGMPLNTTPASLMEEWTIEFRENEFPSLEGLTEAISWEVILKKQNLSKEVERLILGFLIPFNISPAKFLINQDAMSDPHRHTFYEKSPHFSKNLQVFQENPSLKAPGYPDWFYMAFPDVCFWAIRGEGNYKVKELFNHLDEEELVDFTRNQIWEKNLRLIIKAYLESGNKLECSL